MECDCKVDSACTANSADCLDSITGLWFNQLTGLNVLTGILTVVGYILYRFSQALPALVRWPIRIFCTLTGLSSLWSGVSSIVGTVRGIQTLFKWLSGIWKFTVAVLSKLCSLPFAIKTISGALTNAKQLVDTAQQHSREPAKDESPDWDRSSRTSGGPLAHSPISSTPYSLKEPSLRLILLGPSGGGRTSLADSLLGCRAAQAGATTPPALTESTRRKAVIDGREVTLVDTPDLLGPSLGASKRAREALRSLRLAGPGPHAILLVIRAPYSSDGVDQDVAEAIRVALELYGDGVASHMVPVLTHADCLGQGPGCTLAGLLEEDTGALRTALSLCSQRAELVDNGPDCPPEVRRATCTRLVEGVVEMRALGGHFSHELQRREEQVVEELLTDMASALARKLGHI